MLQSEIIRYVYYTGIYIDRKKDTLPFIVTDIDILLEDIGRWKLVLGIKFSIKKKSIRFIIFILATTANYARKDHIERF